MPVAQLDRVFGYEPKGRGLESLLARQRQAAAPTSRSSLLWWSRFFLPAFFIDIYFITLTHVAAKLSQFVAFFCANAASPFGLVSPAGSVGAGRAPLGRSTAPLRKKSRSGHSPQGCFPGLHRKRPRLRLTVATNVKPPFSVVGESGFRPRCPDS